MTRTGAAAGAAIVAVGLGALLVLLLAGGGDSADGALASERQRHASALEAHTGEPILWGNFVVRAARKDAVELRSVELVDATPGVHIRRALVADGSRPEARVLVFESRDFARLRNYPAWRKSLHPLAGYRVRPRARDDELVLELDGLRRGRYRVTGGVRLHYSVDGDDGTIELPNQLLVCAPTPCSPPRPKGF